MKECERRWEIDALRDHVLDGRAKESAELHVRECASCLRHSENIDALARELKASGAAINPFVQRRLRGAILERVAEERRSEANTPEQARRARMMQFGTVCLAAIAVLVGVRFLRGDGDVVALQRAPSLVHAPLVRAAISDDGRTRWSRGRVGTTDRVELHEGRLDLHVAEGPHARFIVAVPDGEIEDIGTQFSVTVSEGHTKEIRVLSGRVVFRRYAVAQVELGAGDIWRDGVVVAVAPSPAQDSADARPAELPTTASKKADASSAESHSQALPSLSREDEAYLRVVEFAKASRKTDAVRAAKAYIARYPNGLRRAEVEKFLSVSNSTD
jgi:hypothetical protein